MKFRFVGRTSQIGIVNVTFGQGLDLDAQTAHDCMFGRVGLVTEVDFDSVGLTEDEQQHYSDMDSHRDTRTNDPDFHVKKMKLHALCVAYREAYLKAAEAGDTFMAREEKAKAPAPVVILKPVPPTQSMKPADPQPATI